MNIKRVKPIFGLTYDVGYIGFTRTDDAVGNMIGWGERFEQKDFPSVNHALIVTGEGECVQAHIDNGVQFGPLAQYLDDPKSKVYFLKPLGWTIDLGHQIALAGAEQIGAHYDKLLIAENALADTLVGHAVNEIFDGWVHIGLDKLIERVTPHQFICSMLAAYALKAQPCYKGLPLFVHPLSSIDPQLLMAAGPFEPVFNDCSHPDDAADELAREKATLGLTDTGVGNDCEKD